MSNRLNLIYALQNGKLVHISEVKRGLACRCNCPACQETLIARKGQKMMHHFAHQSSENCEYGYESSLHLVAKEILAKAKKMILPEVNIVFSPSYKNKILLSKSTEIIIDKVELEQRFRDVIPDIVIYANGRRLFVEIFVTHRIDDEKLNKLKELGISTIEIDLSGIDRSITMEKLTKILLDDSTLKYWKYNAVVDKYLKKFYNTADKRYVEEIYDTSYINDCPIYVKNCPINNRFKYFDDHCYYCDYCIAFFGNYVLCSGRQDISSIEDLKRPDIEEGKDFSKVTKPVLSEKSLVENNDTKVTTLSKDTYISNTKYSSDIWQSLFKQMSDNKQIKMNDEKTVITKSINTLIIESTVYIAKNILSKAKTITFPLPYSILDKQNSYEVVIEHVELNEQIRNDIFDAVIYTNEKPIGILFFISKHLVEEQYNILKTLNIPVLEIDLSHADRYITIKKFAYDLLNNNNIKHWLYYPKA